MAFSNTYDTTNTGSGVSNREHLSDVLTILAPEETPVLSLCPKEKATATFVEWTVDSLAAPVTTGIQEGADVSAFTDKFAGRARLGNYVQKFRRDFMVSDLQNAVDSVGPAKIAQAEAKAVRELKRDIEATFCGTQDRAAEDGAGTAYRLRGLGDWIDSAGPTDVPAAFRTPSGSIDSDAANLTESDFNDLITSIFREVGTSVGLTLVADTALRRIISDYARAEGSTTATPYNVNQDATSKTITLSVSFYDSDHGMVSIVNMNPDCAPDTTNRDSGYLLQPEYLGAAELIPMGSTMLENQGGGERGYVDCALTLMVKSPLAHGKITN
jgi:hypothetical protein